MDGATALAARVRSEGLDGPVTRRKRIARNEEAPVRLRVVCGPIRGQRKDEILVPAGSWGVVDSCESEDDQEEPIGRVRCICASEQEAERIARSLLFPETSEPLGSWGQFPFPSSSGEEESLTAGTEPGTR